MTNAFDAGTYGRSFADVYDDWYSDRDPTPLVELVNELAAEATRGRRASILELGAGTGRLAIPIAEAGHAVTALDSSTEMLDRLAAKGPPPEMHALLGDAANVDDFPDGPFDIVLAAFNLLSNLADRDAQQRCLQAVADRLAPGGSLVVEAFVAEPLLDRRRDLVTRSVTADSVILIATDADPATSSIRGAHIELRDGSVRLRPWRVCVASPEEIDQMAAAVGLRLVARWANASKSPFVAGEHTEHCSVYRR